MILIALTGGIGHGKTTFAGFLNDCSQASLHFESSDLIIEIANQLRQQSIGHPDARDYVAITDWLHILPSLVSSAVQATLSTEAIQITSDAVAKNPDYYRKLFEYLNLMGSRPHLREGTITPENKSEYRSLLQWLGGFLVITNGQGIWFDELIRRVKATKDIELATLGGMRYPGEADRVHSAGGQVVAIVRDSEGHKDSNDLTEREQPQIMADILIDNNGTLEDLQTKASELYARLLSETHAGERPYNAAQY
jgi:hypothetical protein